MSVSGTLFLLPLGKNIIPELLLSRVKVIVKIFIKVECIVFLVFAFLIEILASLERHFVHRSLDLREVFAHPIPLSDV